MWSDPEINHGKFSLYSISLNNLCFNFWLPGINLTFFNFRVTIESTWWDGDLGGVQQNLTKERYLYN